MKGRRRHRQRTRERDPVQSFLDETLTNSNYALYYCNEHGKQFMLPAVRPACPVCGEFCFTPEEFTYRQSLRKRRERRIQLLRNHLE